MITLIRLYYSLDERENGLSMVIKPDRLTYTNNIRERVMIEVRISVTIMK